MVLPKLDSILDLHLEDVIGILDETRYTNALATRLIVRSIMPHRHGGFDAVIDLDNSSNLDWFCWDGSEYGIWKSTGQQTFQEFSID